MQSYRANIKIRLGSAITNTWVEIEAQNINLAKALLEAQYGVGSVICVMRR
jgi:hypothetical protein